MATLPAARARFDQGLARGWDFCVKHGFPLPDGRTEYMWIEVSSWADGRVRGHLASTPAWRTDLSPAQEVEIEEGGVFDWLLASPDGRVEGAATDAVDDGA
jgi:uncharacterized protein YegJ (DUF2314 family)